MTKAVEESRVDAFLDRWHRAVYAKDIAAVGELLAEDVELRAPPYWEALTGKDSVRFLLGVIVNTIETFEYHREWRSGAEIALEFTGTVDGKNLQGIDLITLDADGRIANIDVLMRPINTMIELRERVAPQVQRYLEGLAAED